MATLHWQNPDVEVHKLVVGPVENNVFVVRCRLTGEAVLIDAANEHERLLELCTALGVRRVLETHGHWDHIQAVPAMREAGYEVGVTALDAPRLADVGYDVLLDDKEVIEVGRVRLHALHTPGHSPGSITLVHEADKTAFVGDALFSGSIGRTDFPGCSFEALEASIRSKLYALDKDTTIFPGHGPESTIGRERRSNPFVHD
ncbi:MAG: MBL fold metallo-hydrolase [Actinobacteria bacterium]|nr:MBL fold metallo-hydrolase [Actinomycetota bacterium]